MQTASLPRLMMLLAGLSLAACGDDSDPIKPPENPAPTGLQATATGTNTIQVSWSAPTTPATEFVLHRATGDGDFAEIARPGATATSHADAGLQPGTAYRYRIAAVRSAGTSSFSAIASATTEEEVEDLIVEVTTNITTDTRWTADRTYYLMGFIKVANGATLTIDPGTTIYGDYETLGSSLFVLRGARIVANGTAGNPIVFTSERPVGQRRPGDWGGLIVVGNGIINRSGTVIVEGTATDDVINPAVPYSGGTDNTDNSGTLRYVRVEYAGYAPAQDAELNSFTFAAVGSGTTMEYLQAHNGLDDAFEWFGGAVDGRYLVSYETGDDHFDMSEGYSGRLQYLIAYQSKLLDPRQLLCRNGRGCIVATARYRVAGKVVADRLEFADATIGRAFERQQFVEQGGRELVACVLDCSQAFLLVVAVVQNIAIGVAGARLAICLGKGFGDAP